MAVTGADGLKYQKFAFFPNHLALKFHQTAILAQSSHCHQEDGDSIEVAEQFVP